MMWIGILKCGVSFNSEFTPGKSKSVDELRQRIIEEWEHLDQRMIDNAVKQWRRRLRAHVAAKGGHF